MVQRSKNVWINRGCQGFVRGCQVNWALFHGKRT